MNLPDISTIIENPSCLIESARSIAQLTGPEYLRAVEEISKRVFETYFQIRTGQEIEVQEHGREMWLAPFYGYRINDHQNETGLYLLTRVVEELVVSERTYQNGARGLEITVPKSRVHPPSLPTYSDIFAEVNGKENQDSFQINIYLPFPALPLTAAHCHSSSRLGRALDYYPSLRIESKSLKKEGVGYLVNLVRLNTIREKAIWWTVPLSALGAIRFLDEEETKNLIFIQPNYHDDCFDLFRLEDVNKEYRRLIQVT